MNFRQPASEQVIDLTALFVIMFWGQPMVALVQRAREALLLPDAKDSGVCQAALSRFSRDLEAGCQPPWEDFANIHAQMRRLGGKKKEITYGEATLELIESIGRRMDLVNANYKGDTGENLFSNLYRGSAINKPLVILCALLWAAGERG